MRKILFLLLTALFLWSCQNQNFTIRGTVADPAFEGATVYLQEFVDGSFVTLETTSVQNGTFTFTGTVDGVAVRYVTLNEYRVLILLERGVINVTFSDMILSEFNLRMSEIQQELMAITSKFREKQAAETLTDELREEIIAEHTRVSEYMQNLAIRFIKNNIENESGRDVLRSAINSFSLDVQEELLALTDDDFRAEPEIARVIEHMERASKVAVGRQFIDFTLPNPEGNAVALSDFAGQGNYTLIVFWATWCPPCIQSVPQLREIYARYQNRNFQMVGVSFDRDHDALVNGISNLNITWPQMVDLNRENSVWHLYAIRGIPHTVLLNREGTIIANNLRGEALDNKLAELMP